MKLPELKELIEVLRACGVVHYKCGDVELSLEPVSAPLPVSEKNAKELPVYSAEELHNQRLEMAFKSSGGKVPARLLKKTVSYE